MHRAGKALIVVSLAALVAAGALPAHAKSGRSQLRGGKKPLGEIVSFDAATSALVVELVNSDELTGSVAPDAQVKLEHRGNFSKTAGHGNPSRGSLDDLVAGALVLRLKTEDDVITKLRIRPLPAETGPVPPADEIREDDATEDESDESTEDDADEDETDDALEDDHDDSDDNGSEGPEDDLPPLPAPLP